MVNDHHGWAFKISNDSYFHEESFDRIENEVPNPNEDGDSL